MNDNELDLLLKSSGSCKAPPGFHSDVWNRIAAEPDTGRWPLVWSRILAATIASLSRPATAFATCATFVIAGTLMGIVTRPESTPAAVQYVRTVSPFSHQSER